MIPRFQQAEGIIQKMKVNEFSRRTGIPASRIRYYDRLGLIHGERSNNNYRDFTETDVLPFYHSQVLRSYGMGIDELQDKQYGDIEELREVLDQYIDKTILEIKKQELMLLRLRTMKSFHDLFYEQKTVIHERYLSPNYLIDSFGNNQELTEEDMENIRILADHFPYSYIGVRIPKSSLMNGNEKLDVRLGLGILKENMEKIEISLHADRIRTGGNLLEQLLETEDPFSLKRSDLKPLLKEMERRNLPMQEVAGRVYCSYMKDGILVHGIGLGIILPE